jgi:hypothetical protein
VPISSALAALDCCRCRWLAARCMVGRYYDEFQFVRIQDATRLHCTRLDGANDPMFCCPLLFALGWFIHHRCITMEQSLSET